MLLLNLPSLNKLFVKSKHIESSYKSPLLMQLCLSGPSVRYDTKYTFSLFSQLVQLLLVISQCTDSMYEKKNEKV